MVGMPRIVLKPNSPEYADLKPKSETRSCEMPGCTIVGEHKAPKHRGLNEHYWFCQDHAREYNKAWDFFSGMAPHEVQNHINNSIYGDRPTWRYAGDGTAAEALMNAAWKNYQFTDQERPKEYTPPRHEANTPEFQAMAIMGLKPPVTLDEIKARYKVLAKTHHPDLNGGSQESEELLKQINMAYTILKLAFEEYKRLPDHKF
jgi:DnaJ domain